MKYVSLFVIVVLFFACKPQTGNVRGNIFWKYNNYVGNKPDAGASVTLYSMSDSVKLDAKCDVQGNFIFDKVPVGKYILVVRSQNTTGSADDQLSQILDHINEVNYITRQDIGKLGFTENFEKLKTAVINSYAQEQDPTINYLEIYRKRKKLEDTLQSFSSNALHTIYSKAPINTTPLPLLSKYYYSLLIVEPEKTNNVVVDFGTTYL
ncbi:carboxypeptidase-like regulatory domain-containing protein [Chitinophaga filiformis]|uniref:Carboxypeptidase-like regulatory domain-containing protein n=1 Tax=Chitinophaga filiformis TaxID=104663 RepID=A0ABY4HZS0_CHIFI|nr:carboxypeptidase-like regulatory domain-containing protein [Chitinophaga filiformis]UPK69319.1 carboxypeptidase-like regulatory domain-containing protein [Chitinophaga filiformis]